MKQTLILILSSTLVVTMNAQTIQGNHWSAKRVEGAYTVSIEDGASVLEALTDFITSQKIQAGQVTGIGATNEATLRFFDPSSKKYVDKTFNEQMEISNLSGNISEADGKSLLHLHITLGKKDYTALAGHLLDAKIRGAGEFFVYPINSKVVKVKKEDVGLYFYDFGHQ
jgi:predicted DNA-binding protein with PD1-like motif